MKRNPYFYKTDGETAVVACVEHEWVIEIVQLVDAQVVVTRDNFATRDEALVYMERIGFVDADFGEWWSGSEDSPVKAHLLPHFRNNSERDAERATTISCKNCGHCGLIYCGTYELRTREAPCLAIAVCPKCREFHNVNENADNYGKTDINNVSYSGVDLSLTHPATG